MATWVDGIIANPRPASDAQVRAAERALRVPLPEDFLLVARARQGARPEPANLDLPNGFATAVGHLLHFEDGAGNIVLAHAMARAGLDKGVFPFAEDVGGDLFCFNYREDFDRPTVSFWSVDWGEIPLAPSFTAFVAMLRERPGEPDGGRPS